MSLQPYSYSSPLAGVAFAVYIMLVASSIYVYFFGIFLLVLSVIAGFFNTVSAYFYYKSFFYDGYLAKITAGLKPLKRFPTVAVGVPVKNEDPKIVREDHAPAEGDELSKGQDDRLPSG